MADAPDTTTPPRGRHRRLALRIGFGVATLVICVGLVGYRLLMPGAVFLTRLADTSAESQYQGRSFVESEVQIPFDGRQLRARVYRPTAPHHRTLLLVHGVHTDGIDEARFVPVARKLAGMGFAVVTPELRDLAGYEILARTVDEIERSAVWTLDDSGLVPSGGRIGVMGICFGGGLCVSAAGRDGLQDRVAFLFSMGGHADLSAVLRYMATGALPGGDAGALPAPHIYGVAVVLRQLADRCVPAEQVEPLRECLRRYLNDDKETATRLKDALAQPAQRYAAMCLDRDSAALGAVLEPHLAAATLDRWLSPIQCPAPRCPVYLLHAAGDNIIPPAESRRLATHLAAQTDATVLVSDQLDHVDFGGESLTGQMALARFMTRVMRE